MIQNHGIKAELALHVIMPFRYYYLQFIVLVHLAYLARLPVSSLSFCSEIVHETLFDLPRALKFFIIKQKVAHLFEW